jgi:hypothetical protein
VLAHGLSAVGAGLTAEPAVHRHAKAGQVARGRGMPAAQPRDPVDRPPGAAPNRTSRPAGSRPAAAHCSPAAPWPPPFPRRHPPPSCRSRRLVRAAPPATRFFIQSPHGRQTACTAVRSAEGCRRGAAEGTRTGPPRPRSPSAGLRQADPRVAGPGGQVAGVLGAGSVSGGGCLTGPNEAGFPPRRPCFRSAGGRRPADRCGLRAGDLGKLSHPHSPPGRRFRPAT